MRLRDLKEILKKNIEYIDFSTSKNNDNNYQVIGLQRAINAINELSIYGFLDGDIERLKKHPNIYYSKAADDRMYLTPATYNEINSIMSVAREKIEGFMIAMDKAIPNQENSSLSIKLPNYTDLSQLSGFFKDLNQALSQTLAIEEIDAQAKIQNFDSGSLWVEVGISSLVGMQVIGTLLKSALIVRQEVYKTDLAKKQVEMLDLRQEFVEELTKASTQHIRSIIDAETKNLLAKESNVEYSPESLERMKSTVKIFSQLVNEGTQFYPALNAPEEVNESFPTFPEISQLETSIRRIETTLEDTNEIPPSE